MHVKLIAHTVPVNAKYGGDAAEFVAYVARVSNPANQWNHDTAEKLLKYLEDHKHWSPFEMYNVVLEIESTRDIIRQFLRHHSFRFQEFSQRYAEVGADMFAEPREARLQDDKNRQNSIETDDADLQADWHSVQNYVKHYAHAAYDWALERGIAKEVARAVLPEGLVKSRVYAQGSLRSWVHYIAVRADPSTQKEHREIADEARKIIHGLLTSGDK